MRTEYQVLKDFEKLGYEIIQNNDTRLVLQNDDVEIYFYKFERSYGKEDIFSNEANRIEILEHVLINELIKIYGWL